MKIVNWVTIGYHVGTASPAVADFCRRKQIVPVFHHRSSPEGKALLTKVARHMGRAISVLPAVVIVQNDGEIGEVIWFPNEKRLQDALDKFGKSNPTWGGKQARQHAAPR